MLLHLHPRHAPMDSTEPQTAGRVALRVWLGPGRLVPSNSIFLVPRCHRVADRLDEPRMPVAVDQTRQGDQICAGAGYDTPA
jgi:hypothetical protein